MAAASGPPASGAAALALHAAFVRGDLDGLRRVLGDPAAFPNNPMPQAFGDSALEYAIYHAPLSLVAALLAAGADPNYASPGGFPSLLAALAAGRADTFEVLTLLLAHGADVGQRGINDYTALHYAARLDDVKLLAHLVAHGADPLARTAIDDYATPAEEAVRAGATRSAAYLRKFTA